MDHQAAYWHLENKIAQWAGSQPDLPLGLVIGSRARLSPGPDVLSDLDLVLFVSNIARYFGDKTWLHQFGEIELMHLFYQDGEPEEWQVIYSGGLKVDFTLFQIPADLGPVVTLKAILDIFPHKVVISRGFRLLGQVEPLVDSAGVDSDLPGAAQFKEFYIETLFAFLRAGKMIQRGELWHGQRILNAYLHDRLLSVIQWHTRLNNPQSGDLWYYGRYMQRWVAPEIMERLPGTFAGYDRQNLRQALLAALEMFVELSQEVALKSGFSLPRDETGVARRMLDAIFMTEIL